MSLYKPCPVPCCQGRPRTGQTRVWQTLVRLSSPGTSFRRAVGLAWRKTLWPGQLAKSWAVCQGPGPPNAGLSELQISVGLVWEGTDFVLFLSVAGPVLRCVGMLVLLPNLGSSWSYKLHSSLHPLARLPCPRVIRDHPDCGCPQLEKPVSRSV